MMRLLLMAAFCVCALASEGFPLEPTEKLVYEKNSLYQYLTVIDDTSSQVRYVRNRKKELIQGGIYLNDQEKLLFEFTQMVFVSLAFLDRKPEDVLFVGLGAGVMPRYLSKHYPEARIDIVEIDPEMIDVAKRYFGFKENDRMRVYAEDGRVFVKRSKKRYDWIVLDAFQNDHIPFHLTTLEYLREVRKKLKEGGVVAANIVSPYRNYFFDSMVMTYKKAFGRLDLFKGKKSINYIFVATADGRPVKKDAIEARASGIQAEKNFDIDLPGFASWIEDSGAYEWSEARILTDDFAPVNVYQHRESEAR